MRWTNTLKPDQQRQLEEWQRIVDSDPAIQRLMQQSREALGQYQDLQGQRRTPGGADEEQTRNPSSTAARQAFGQSQQQLALALKAKGITLPDDFYLDTNTQQIHYHPDMAGWQTAAILGGMFGPSVIGAFASPAGSAATTGGTLATVGTGSAIPASAGAAGTGIGFVPAGASAGVSGLTGVAGASAGASSAIAGRSLLGTILSGAIPTAADLIAAKIQSDAINRSTDISASTAKEALDYLKAQKAKQETAWEPFAAVGNQAITTLPSMVRGPAGPAPAPFTGIPGQGPTQTTLATLGTSPPAGAPLGPPRMPIGGQGPSVGAPMPGPGQPQPMAAGGLVLLEAPDGTRQQVPAAMVQALVARGARQVSP